MFGRKPKVDQHPYLGDAVALAQRLMATRDALIALEDTYAKAVRTRDSALLETIPSLDARHVELREGCDEQLGRWIENWAPENPAVAPAKLRAFNESLMAMHVGVALEWAVYSRQMTITDPESQRWLGQRNGHGLGLAAAAKQHFDGARLMETAQVLGEQEREARQLFHRGERLLDEVCERFPYNAEAPAD